MYLWFKQLLSIVKNISVIEYQQYKVDIKKQEEELHRLRRQIVHQNQTIEAMKNPVTHADIHPSGRDANYIIVVGRYRGADYVECQVIPPDYFRETVERLRYIRKGEGRLGRVDAPPSFKSCMIM